MNKPICLFDSGIGGLTVLKKLLDKFPSEQYIYFADLARVPFGDRTNNEIKEIAKEIIEYLAKSNPKLIIMACNTSSAVLSSELQTISSYLSIPIYGMIESCVKDISALSYSQVTVWATKLAVENNGYKKAIHKLNTKIKVEEVACPKLVPMIEELSSSLSHKRTTIQEYLEKTSKDTQALILGCTHYPLISNELSGLTKLKIIDPANNLINDLVRNNILDTSTEVKKQISFYTTAQVEKVERFVKEYLYENYNVNLVSTKKTYA